LTLRCVYRGATTIERARARLSEATVLVLPSRAEPFPMVLLEAFACGLPAVITDETGLSRTAQETGAAVVTDGSPDQLADAVMRLLSDRDLWTRTAGSARTLAEQRFTLERIAERLTAIYRQAASQGAAS
jgi:glycosyltransferase involved in cell wall biosynthesis